MDPYQILGISRNSSVEEAKRAYKKLAMKYHPDKGGDTEQFKKISSAYDMIKGTKVGNSRINSNNFEDFFNNRMQAKVNVTIQITLQKAILGGEELVQLKIANNPAEQRLKINIPKGLLNGEQIKYPKLLNGNDLYITFLVKDDPIWVRKDIDLIKHQSISIWDMITGTTIDVETISGNTVRITVPPKSQPNNKLKLSKLGAQKRHNHLIKGDMYVIMDAYIPEVISEDLLNLVQQEKEK